MSSATGEPQDLVVVALGGVQRFIAESRTTADAAASSIMAMLARTAAEACGAEPGVRLVFPEYTADAVGAPNRVVALVPAGQGTQVATGAAAAVHAAWSRQVARTFVPRGRRGRGNPEDLRTPGMPDVTWVAVPAAKGNYAVQWDLAQRALAARRRVRDFVPVDKARRPLCSLSPRWAASDPPPGARKHHRDERLSLANWTKRQWSSGESGRLRFPSTYAIASGVFRRAVADHLDDRQIAASVRELRAAVAQAPRSREAPVPGFAAEPDDPLGGWLAESAGGWVYPGRWTQRTLQEDFAAEGTRDGDADRLARIAEQGRRASQALIARMAERGVPAPALYLAVIAQDLDGMGDFLSGVGAARNGTRITVTPEDHAQVSRRLLTLGAEQSERLSSRELLGVPIYTGGDDLLAFAPAATALAAAEAVYGLVPDDLPTASTAVLYFHQHTSLRRAIAEVQSLLHKAKHNVADKHALAVGYLCRSGVRAESIQPWTSPATDTPVSRSFALLGSEGEHPLSPGLVADLERDSEELSGLPARVYTAELRRLVERHTGGQPGQARREFALSAAQALADLGARERSEPGSARPVPFARVGVFLRQEAR